MRLIIADDEKVIRETISSFINWKSLGIEVVATCKDGIEAYNAIVDEYPDIVLTDIKMPGITGLELIERIHKLDQHIEFIILSGYEEFSFAKEAMKYGVRHYLLKPCNEKQIITAVQEIQQHWYMNEADSRWKRESAAIQQSFQTQSARSDFVQVLEQKLESLDVADGRERNMIFAEIGRTAAPIADQDTLVLLASGLLLKYADRSNVSYSPMQLMDYITELRQMKSADAVKESLKNRLPVIFQPPLTASKGTADFINRIISYIDNNLADPDISLKNLSEQHLFMNVDYVSKQFARQTGYRFSDFLNRKRVETAKQLLTQNADVQIQDVAEKVGFGNNPQYFCLIFKKYTGLTPSAYISSWKKNALT